MKRTQIAVVPFLVVGVWGCSETVQVEPAAPIAGSVSITQTDVSFSSLGATVDLEATVVSIEGGNIPEAPVQWSAEPRGVVSVDAVSGVVTAIGNGVDTVHATIGTVSDAIEVTVQQVPVSVELLFVAPLTVAGSESPIDALVRDASGRSVSGVSLIWTSSDPTVAVVNDAGRVTAIKTGSTTITGALGSMESTVVVAVNFDGPVGGVITGPTTPCLGGMAETLFPCDRIDLLSYLPISALGGPDGTALNDMWGWTDTQTGFEYALVGRIDGISFVNVTDPNNPIYLGHLGQTSQTPARIWRDVKVYKDHAYVVADLAGEHGVQVFDLSELRDFDGVPTTFRGTSLYSGVGSVHNIAINEQTGFAYAVGSSGGTNTCGGGLHMIDLSNATAPTFAGCFTDPLTGQTSPGYSHDVQCVVYTGPDADHTGKELCFALNESALSIADVTDKSNPVAVSRATYPGVVYAHQGWLTDDQRYLFTNDELDEISGTTTMSRTLVWDVIDVDDPVLVKEYLGPTPAIDHNLYIVGNLLYAANYQAGMRVLDITDPANPVERGRFDTAPLDADVATEDNFAAFNGSWTAYPFFSNGTIAVTSQNEGLFLLKLN